MPRSVIDIDVNDEKFKAFLQLFRDYQTQLKNSSGLWHDASAAAGGAETASLGMVDALAAGAASTVLISDALSRAEPAALRTATHMERIAGHAKSAAGFIVGATEKLLKWSALSLGAGLIGGGLWGLDKLGESVASTRRTSMGLGISAGELQSFNVNFGTRLGLGTGFLETIQNASSDRSNPAFVQMGIPWTETQDKDAGDLGIDVVRRAHALWRQAGPQGHTQQQMQVNGLGALGMGFGMWRSIGTQSEGDLDKWIKDYHRNAQSLNVSDPTQRAWTELATQLDEAAKQIEKVFVTGLIKLNVVKWADELAKVITSFGDYLGSEKFDHDLKLFVDGVGEASTRMVGFLRFIHLLPRAESSAPGIPTTYPNGDASLPTLPRTGPSVDAMMSRSFRGGDGKYDFSGVETANGLPSGLLRAVGMQESGLNPHPKDSVVNGKHYQGMFQMGPESQAHYHVTDPYDPNQEASAAGMMLSDLLHKYRNDLEKALAGYNWGGGNDNDPRLDAAIAKYGGRWKEHAPAETRNYIRDIERRMGVAMVNLNVSVTNQTGANVAVTANSLR